MQLKTLHRIGHPLSRPQEQLRILGDPQWIPAGSFDARLGQQSQLPLLKTQLRILQINLGKVCNQTCAHCHVDAGPDRRESMSRETAQEIVDFLERGPFETLDITGGAPEMNPNFTWLVEEATRLNRKVIDRCNLTILRAPRFDYLPQFLADHRVAIVASLPCYLEENCDAQRGSGVFQQSIDALRDLNQLGYGHPESGLELNLVYNPVGTGLPPSQEALEADYRRELRNRYKIEFSRLFAITNMPISRFLDDLLRRGEYLSYMQQLVQSFNPGTIDGLMCRDMLSVDWNGYLYDCDFNQMLDLAIAPCGSCHISQISPAELIGRAIRTANHCFGCTAGSGSSCQGSTVAAESNPDQANA